MQAQASIGAIFCSTLLLARAFGKATYNSRCYVASMTNLNSELLNPEYAGTQFSSDIAAMDRLATREQVSFSSQQREHPAVFAARFYCCHRLLHFIACRVLGSSERAEDVIANCLMTASRNPPKLKYEGGFRSWLLRVLICASAVNGTGRCPISMMGNGLGERI